MGEFDPGLGENDPSPINRQSPLEGEEVRQSLRHLLESYNGVELLDRLTEFVMLSSIEVLLVKDPSPEVLGRLSGEKLEALRTLNPEI